jgi:hypothetical protein
MVALTAILAMADPLTAPDREDYPGACSAFYQELKPGDLTPPTPFTLSSPGLHIRTYMPYHEMEEALEGRAAVVELHLTGGSRLLGAHVSPVNRHQSRM